MLNRSKLTWMAVLGTMLWLMPSRLLAQSATKTPLLVLQEGSHSLRIPSNGFWRENIILPTFVLYDDGLVLFRMALNSTEVRSSQLTRLEIEEWISLIEQSGFWELQESYHLTMMLEQPISVIKYRHDGDIRRIAVTGRMRENKDRARAPKTFVELFDRMVSFAPTGSKVWEPLRVEVRIFPFEKSDGKPLPWPKGWPDLTDGSTKTFITYETYLLYIDGRNRKKLEQLMASLKEKQAVSIGGLPWFASLTRYCLPAEEQWQGK